MTSMVAWSRIMSNREVVCAINTDLAAARSAWVTIDARLHAVGDKFQYAYSTDSTQVGSPVSAQARNGLAISVTVPAGWLRDPDALKMQRIGGPAPCPTRSGEAGALREWRKLCSVDGPKSAHRELPLL